MSKDPAVLFYTSDFLSGTYTMTNEEAGMYIRLLCIQHQKGHLAERDLLAICGGQNEAVFAKFVKDEAGRYYNDRMYKEANRRKKYAESRSLNSKSICSAYVNHMDHHMETETIKEDTVFLKKLATIYSYINIDKEMCKMDAWLLANPGRKKTRRFIVNWLNKVDKPMEVAKPKVQYYKAPEYMEQPHDNKAISDLIHKTVKEMK